MHHNGTAAHERLEAGPVSPVITREDGWLGDDDRDQSLVLQLRLPVSADEMVAALYGDEQLSPADLAADENVWGFAACAIAQDGMNHIERRADQIAVEEAQGTLVNRAWLELCRRRVAEVTDTVATRSAAASTPIARTARAGAQPPTTTPFQQPCVPQQETIPPRPRTPGESVAHVRALTELAAPCRAGN